VQELAAALQVFSTASYGRRDKTDGDALDSALEQGTRAVKRMRSHARWSLRAALQALGAAPATGASRQAAGTAHQAPSPRH
jgi:hypothetical protein